MKTQHYTLIKDAANLEIALEKYEKFLNSILC